MKESDIRPADLLNEYLRLSAEDAKAFFSSKTRATIPCPGCDTSTDKTAFIKHGFAFCECSGCGTLYQSPRPTREDFAKFYADSPSSTYWAQTFFPAVAEARREKIFAPRVNRIQQLCSEHHFKPSIVMDVGAGYGIFLEEWKKQSPQTKCLAVEPGQSLAKTCRDKGFEVLEELAENSTAWAEKADLVTCFEVIEHVQHPLEFIQSIHRLVRKGGYAVITGLCVDGFDIQTLWEKSNSVSPPHHINFFSNEGFSTVFKKAGFSEVTILTPGQLDADIVKNAFLANAEAFPEQRFAKTLIKRGAEALEDFQKFLARYNLSSHAWILAKK